MLIFFLLELHFIFLELWLALVSPLKFSYLVFVWIIIREENWIEITIIGFVTILVIFWDIMFAKVDLLAKIDEVFRAFNALASNNLIEI